MTAHGFTAGPWTATVEIVYPDGWRLPEQMISIGTKETLIALYSTNSMEYPSDEESEANARLIAAAPRYHAAAEEMLRVAEVGVVNDLEAFGRAIRLLREAHAAANGSRG